MCDTPSVKTEELSTAELKKIIKDSSGLGVQTIVFSGGEPLIRQDIYDLIAFTGSNNMSACLTSNGSLIDEIAALRLSKAGVNVVNISIEGCKDIHDALRGIGSYDLAANGLVNLRKHKIESTIAATVSRHNFESISSIIGIAKEFGATTVRFQPFNEIFLTNKASSKDFFINKDNLKTAGQVVEEVIKLARENRIATNPESYLRNIPLYLCTGKVLFQGPCNALWYSCPVDSAGNVFPCWNKTDSKQRIGSLRESNLSELWFSEKRERIIGSIIDKGCAGCMMSCYDEVFDKSNLKDSVTKKIINVSRKNKKKLFNKLLNQTSQSVKGELTRLKFRLRFYRSYKKSLFKVIKRRISAIFYAKKAIDCKDQLGLVLSEIDMVKKRLNKEINQYK
jgi:radical SAM protein with 4Fe4S-binding SPASM domain